MANTVVQAETGEKNTKNAADNAKKVRKVNFSPILAK